MCEHIKQCNMNNNHGNTEAFITNENNNNKHVKPMRMDLRRTRRTFQQEFEKPQKSKNSFSTNNIDSSWKYSDVDVKKFDKNQTHFALSMQNISSCSHNTKQEVQHNNIIFQRLEVNRRTQTKARKNVHADYASRVSRTEHVHKSTDSPQRQDADQTAGDKTIRRRKSIFKFLHLRIPSSSSRKKQPREQNTPTQTENETADDCKGVTRGVQSSIRNGSLEKETPCEILNGDHVATQSRNICGIHSQNKRIEENGYSNDKTHRANSPMRRRTMRHSLNLECFAKRRSWVAMPYESYPSITSLPGPETELVGGYCQDPQRYINDIQDQFQPAEEPMLTKEYHKPIIIGAPIISQKQRTNSYFETSNLGNKVRRNASDLSPFMQRHGIHGLPDPNEENEGRKSRTGLSRSQSMFKPTKPTTPKPAKDGGSLSDIRFRFQLGDLQDHGMEITESGSLCDLRPLEMNSWKRHSVCAMNIDRRDSFNSAPRRSISSRHLRKRSRPLSEVGGNGVLVTAIPENAVLFTNDEKQDNTNLIQSSTNMNQTEKTALLPSNDIREESNAQKPEDTMTATLLNNELAIHNADSLHEKEYQLRRRGRIMSESFCDPGSLEELAFEITMSNLAVPRPLSVIGGINLLELSPGHHPTHLNFLNNRHHDTKHGFDLNTSLSIPDGLDFAHRRKLFLENSVGSDIYLKIQPVQWNSSSDDITDRNIFDVRDNKLIKSSDMLTHDVKSSYVEALWDHVTMDEEELSFRVGDVIIVKNMEDPVWWWGELDHAEGWFPASFVRVVVNQSWPNFLNEIVVEVPTEEETEMEVQFVDEVDAPAPTTNHCQHECETAKWNKMRSNVIREILNSERDFLKQLEDVVQGYLERCRKRVDMFTNEEIHAVFSNIEDIYKFEKQFTMELEENFNSEFPHESDVGSIFLRNKSHFEIYSTYCNNHPTAMSMLAELMSSKKIRYFFEACRLLQKMINISIDGFLLTPVQKICKYPLQLAELLKYTKADDPNYETVKAALKTMQDVARMINERKRQVENIEKITIWQKNIINWQDGDVLEKSTQLIHTGEFYMMTIPRSKAQLRVGFLFDDQLIICKKDLLRKDLLYYKRRLNLNEYDVIDSREFDDDPSAQLISNISWKNWWKIQSKTDPEQVIICVCKKEELKEKWMSAFRKEKMISNDEERRPMLVTEDIKKEIVEKTILRCQRRGGDSNVNLTYRQRLKMVQRSRKMALSPDKNTSTATFFNNIATKLTPFRKLTGSIQMSSQIPI